MALTCSSARRAENEVGGASAGRGAGSQKVESPTAAANAQTKIHHQRSGFIELQAYRSGETDQTENRRVSHFTAG